MNDTFKLVSPAFGFRRSAPAYLRPEELEPVRAFHRSFPMYAPTPLVQLPRTAQALGLGNVYVKDESCRFGLNAFKVLGGSYAIARILGERLQQDAGPLHYAALTSQKTRQSLGTLTFVTATDGNHGRGIAWAARTFGHRSVVYLPRGSSEKRLQNIRAEGAEAEITDMNYDDAVRYAGEQAAHHGWILVQDTAWEAYETIPRWIMQGYGTMGLEALEQLPERPTHVFLQAGVGSMAGSIAGLLSHRCGSDRPIIVIVEPNQADCHYRTALANDGRLHRVSGDLATLMAGLACGEPCSLGWEILSSCADHFISFPDYAAANGMRILGNPLPGDKGIISGESGAAAFGCVAEIMRDPELAWMKEALQLNGSSRVLFFSTEGDTDSELYRSIVWDGAYAVPGR